MWPGCRAGVGPAQASREVGLIGGQLDLEHPRSGHWRRDWTIQRNATEILSDQRLGGVPGLAVAVSVLLVLITSLNLANLSLARGTHRLRENAIRSALGASRWRLVREHLVESVLITLAGGALAWGILVTLLHRLSAELPITREIDIPVAPELSPSVMGVAVTLLVLAVLVFGLWPALQSTRRDVRHHLERGGVATPPRWRLHRAMVAWQVCGSVALFLAAAVCIGAVTSRSRAEPQGYEKLAAAYVDFGANGKSEAETKTIIDEMLTTLRLQQGMASMR